MKARWHWSGWHTCEENKGEKNQAWPGRPPKAPSAAGVLAIPSPPFQDSGIDLDNCKNPLGLVCPFQSRHLLFPSPTVSMLTPWRKSAFSFYHCLKIASMKVTNDTLLANSNALFSTLISPDFLGALNSWHEEFYEAPRKQLLWLRWINSHLWSSLHLESGGPGDWSSATLQSHLCSPPAPSAPARMAFSSCTLSLFRAFAHTIHSARCAGLQTPQGAGSYPGVGGVSGRVLPFNDASIETFLDDPCKNCPLCYFLIENNILPSEYISVCKDSHVCTYSGNLCHPHGDRSSLRGIISVGLTLHIWHLIQCQEHGRKESPVVTKMCSLHQVLLLVQLLLLSHFSRVRLCVTPQTAADQAPPSLGFPK